MAYVSNVTKTTLKDIAINFSERTWHNLKETEEVIKILRKNVPILINNIKVLQQDYTNLTDRTDRNVWVRHESKGQLILKYATQAYQLIERAREHFTGEVIKYAIQIQNQGELDIAIVSFEDLLPQLKLIKYHGDTLKIQISKNNQFQAQIAQEKFLSQQGELGQKLVVAINTYYKALLEIWAYTYNEFGEITSASRELKQKYQKTKGIKAKQEFRKSNNISTIQQGRAFEAAVLAAIYNGDTVTPDELLKIYRTQIADNAAFYRAPDIYLKNEDLIGAGEAIAELAKEVQGLQLKSFANTNAQLLYIDALVKTLETIQNIIMLPFSATNIKELLNHYVLKAEKNIDDKVSTEINTLIEETKNKVLTAVQEQALVNGIVVKIT